jgi:hypothetical protein
MVMTLRLVFSGTDDMVRTVRNSGTTHWFSPDTLRWFRARIGDALYGRVFVTSERNPSGVRRYSIRLICVSDDAYTVQTVGVFGAYSSRGGAHSAASRLAKVIADAGTLPEYVTDSECDDLAARAGIPLSGGFNA